MNIFKKMAKLSYIIDKYKVILSDENFFFDTKT